MSDPRIEVQKHGQSLWYDLISRDLLLSGELRRLVEHEGVRGVTSNPAIFEKAIAGSSDYDAATRTLVRQDAGSALDLYEALAIQDIQLGCDVLLPVWQASEGRDGFVSLEVSPHLAYDTEATVEEALRLAAAVGRENLMIKVPATPEGVPAIQRLIAAGQSINVTLLFSVTAYDAVHEAYMAGLEERLAKGLPIERVASVASFFVSRIDAAFSKRITAKIEAGCDESTRERMRALEARVAIANAERAYASFRETLAGSRWQALERAGAQPQRVLWASTGTKDPKLPMTLYVDTLIGAHTVNTVPAATFDAFGETGAVRDALGDDPAPLRARADEVLDEVEALGISLDEITSELLDQGCRLFCDAFDALIGAVEAKRQSLLGEGFAKQSIHPGAVASGFETRTRDWGAGDEVRRLYAKDASLFTGADEARWMGWLELPWVDEIAAAGPADLRRSILEGGFSDVVVLGMGGSSLFPEVAGLCLGADAPTRLRIIDSTVPDEVEARLAALDLAKTLFIVASKSGSTIEPNALLSAIWPRVEAAVGHDAVGDHFVAITDPGSAMEERARAMGFRGVALGRPDVGGRFSALSPFGLLPCAAIGLDVPALRARVRRQADACAAHVPATVNPGVQLGLVIAAANGAGRDKLTLIAPEPLAPFGDWLEQLVAESSGKRGRGIVPIVREALGDAGVYGDDRIFVSYTLAGEPEPPLVSALESAGHPVVRIALAEVADLVGELFRWEIATAVACAEIGVNAFDQPDVESAKVAARRLMAGAGGGEGRSTGGDGPSLRAGIGADAGTLEAGLAALLDGIGPGDLLAMNAFIERKPEHESALAALRRRVRDARKVATSVGFGPRFLHSTGQLHKGGSARTRVLHLTAGDRARPEIPGETYDFAVLRAAQAQGDFEVLEAAGRKILWIDLGDEPQQGLEALGRALDAALAGL